MAYYWNVILFYRKKCTKNQNGEKEEKKNVFDTLSYQCSSLVL